MPTGRDHALATWFREEGGRCSAVVRHEHGLRGMFAARDIAEGEVVMRVPRHMVLTHPTAQYSPIGLRMHPAKLRSSDSLAVFLADARRHGGYWRPMIDALPDAFPGLPMNYRREDWALLQGTYARRFAERSWRMQRRAFRRIKAVLPPVQRVALREYLWARQIVATRAFILKIDGAEVRGLVPMADLINHALRPNCTWGGEHSRAFVVHARQPIRAGDELTITYGARSNSHLLAKYGFYLRGNPHDEVELSFTLATSPWLHEFARDLTEGYDEQEFVLGRDPLSEEAAKMFSLLRLRALPDAEAARSLPQLQEGKLASVPALDADNERAALEAIADQCRQALDGYTCPAEDDDRLLLGDTLTPIQRGALEVRRGEKRVLLSTLSQVRDALAVLELPAGDRAAALGRRVSAGGSWAGYFKHLQERFAAEASAQAPTEPAACAA